MTELNYDVELMTAVMGIIELMILVEDPRDDA